MVSSTHPIVYLLLTFALQLTEFLLRSPSLSQSLPDGAFQYSKSPKRPVYRRFQIPPNSSIKTDFEAHNLSFSRVSPEPASPYLTSILIPIFLTHAYFVYNAPAVRHTPPSLSSLKLGRSLPRYAAISVSGLVVLLHPRC